MIYILGIGVIIVSVVWGIHHAIDREEAAGWSG